MWSFGIVLLAELFGEHACFRHAGEEGPVQELIAKPAVEALSESILPGAARRYEVRSGLLTGQPCLKRLGNELRAVVTPEEARRSVLCEQAGEQSDDSAGRDRGGHLNAEYLAKHGQAAESIAATADEGKYDLLLMGSHGHGLLGNLVMGSTATKVLAHCGVPVLLIR